MCNTLLKLLICSNTQQPPPPFLLPHTLSLSLPCRKANDRHVSRQRDLFSSTWTLFAGGTNTSAMLQLREQQSDRRRRPGPGQVWGSVWYASLRCGINTRPVSRSSGPRRAAAEWRAFQTGVIRLDGMSLIHVCKLITFSALKKNKNKNKNKL